MPVFPSWPAVLQVIYVVTLTVACVVTAVNALATITALIGRKIFTPEGKWSPMSFMKLTHEVRFVCVCVVKCTCLYIYLSP